MDHIKIAISVYDWITELNLRSADPNLQVEHFTEILNNVISNYIPHEDITIKPPWASKNSSRTYHKYMRAYKSYIRNGCKPEMIQHINNLKENYTSLVENAREKYLLSQSQKLSHPDTGTKTYWSILKNFLNKNKFPIIPHLFHLNKFITNFQEKATFFFASQCIVLETGSQFPSFCATTDSILENILFSDDDIITHIRCLNPNKAHGWNSITIHMIQICVVTLVILPTVLKRGLMSFPVYKKDCKQLVKNYRPISLLPVFGKIFEKILFNNLYPYLITNNLIFDKHSGFKIGDTTVNQLLFICLTIQCSICNYKSLAWYFNRYDL